MLKLSAFISAFSVSVRILLWMAVKSIDKSGNWRSWRRRHFYQNRREPSRAIRRIANVFASFANNY